MCWSDKRLQWRMVSFLHINVSSRELPCSSHFWTEIIKFCSLYILLSLSLTCLPLVCCVQNWRSCSESRASRLQEGGSVCVCISLNREAEVMGPRRKASKLQPVGGSGGGELVSKPSEPKDYINELSHEVLCHIFRYTDPQLIHSFVYFKIYSKAVWRF